MNIIQDYCELQAKRIQDHKEVKIENNDSTSEDDDIDVMAYIEQQIGIVRETRDPQMKMKQYIVVNSSEDDESEEEAVDDDLFSSNTQIEIEASDPDFPS